MNPFIYHELTEIAAILDEILKVLKEIKEMKEVTIMTRYEWAMMMYETYAKQNDCEQAEYYYKMAQYFKKTDKN